MKRIKTREDINRALEIFYAGFMDSLGIMWVLKRKTILAKKMTIRILFHEGHAKEGAYLTEDINGALLFYETQDNRSDMFNSLRKLYLVLVYAGIRNGLRLITYRKMIATTRPKDALVGFLVATDQNIRGSEAAFEIKREMFNLADKLKKTICLETSIPRVRKLYQLSGYEEYASVNHPYEDLTIWFFKREFKNG